MSVKGFLGLETSEMLLLLLPVAAMIKISVWEGILWPNQLLKIDTRVVENQRSVNEPLGDDL